MPNDLYIFYLKHFIQYKESARVFEINSLSNFKIEKLGLSQKQKYGDEEEDDFKYKIGKKFDPWKYKKLGLEVDEIVKSMNALCS